jgi:hypothetical protein
LPGLLFKIGFGRRIGLREEVVQIAGFAPYASKLKKRRRTSSPIADTQRDFGDDQRVD